MNWRRFGLPLLAKELIERAARKRTYVGRVLFAGLLYGLCLMSNHWIFQGISRPDLSGLGRGESLLNTLLVLQMGGIYLFVPAMTAGLFTIEKERDSLSLLFLTKLGPWQILWQKYLGVLVPVASLLLLTLPMAAVAYAYGGVTTEALFGGGYVLVVTAAQAAALALMCSAYFRTTVGAFFGTCCVGGLLYGSVPLAIELLEEPPWNVAPIPLEEIISGIFPPGIQFEIWRNSSGLSPVLGYLLLSIPAWVVTAIALGLARFWLVRRAFASGPSQGMRVFRWMDRGMQRLNARVGNVELAKNLHALPGAHPVAWREMKQKALAQPHYLMRLLLLIEVPLLGVMFLMFSGANGSIQRSDMPILLGILGGLAAVAVSIHAANAFVSERVNQTLDVLLTTPLSARQIVQEKARVMRRFMAVAAVPLVTVILFEWSMRDGSWDDGYRNRHMDGSMVYLVSSLLGLAVYLPMVSWLSLWVGLRARTRFRAILTALALLTAWCVAPIFLAVWLSRAGRWDSLETFSLMALSPAAMPVLTENLVVHQIHADSPWTPILLNYAFYGAILFLLRQLCLREADFYLRRQSHAR